MALTLNFVDSYDHYNTSEIGKKWDVAGPSSTIDATGTKSRTGTGCLVINSGHGATKVVPANDHFIMSSAFHPNGAIPFGTFFNIMWLVEAVGGFQNRRDSRDGPPRGLARGTDAGRIGCLADSQRLQIR